MYRMNRIGSAALQLLSEQDFTLPAHPTSDCPELPDDVTELDMEGLMHLYTRFIAWADYARAQVALAMITERDAENSLEQAESAVWKKMPKSSPVTSTREIVPSDPDVREAKNRLLEVYAYRKLITDISDRMERNYTLLSRELTRRTAESSPKSRRRERWD